LSRDLAGQDLVGATTISTVPVVGGWRFYVGDVSTITSLPADQLAPGCTASRTRFHRL